MNKIKFIYLSFIFFTFFSCTKNSPKPSGYYRIEIPENKYEIFNKEGYPYVFDLSKHAQIIERQETKQG
jgi:hypothetical protein